MVLDEAEPLEPRECLAIQHPLEPVRLERLVEAQPEHDALAGLHVRFELLELALREPRPAGRRARYRARLGRFRDRMPPTVDTAPMPTPR